MLVWVAAWTYSSGLRATGQDVSDIGMVLEQKGGNAPDLRERTVEHEGGYVLGLLDEVMDMDVELA